MIQKMYCILILHTPRDERSSLNTVLSAVRELEMAQRYVLSSCVRMVFTIHGTMC